MDVVARYISRGGGTLAIVASLRILVPRFPSPPYGIVVVIRIYTDGLTSRVFWQCGYSVSPPKLSNQIAITAQIARSLPIIAELVEFGSKILLRPQLK